MDTANLQIIRESFGRVVYSHKTHEKAAEIETCNTNIVKWINILLTSLTSTSVLGNLIFNQDILRYTSSLLAVMTLAFVIFQLSFNPEANAEKHRQAAKELWFIREKYVCLLVDIKNQSITAADIILRRDRLIEELKIVYKHAIQTNSRAYRAAQKALKISEDLTFSNDEINHFLPEELHIS